MFKRFFAFADVQLGFDFDEPLADAVTSRGRHSEGRIAVERAAIRWKFGPFDALVDNRPR